jgi:outer membrane lipoprotein SlyB
LRRIVTYSFIAISVASSIGCKPDYSPNIYAANAVQQANKVEAGVVVGFRQVAISANGTVGAVTGGAAGGILGSQAGGSGISTALAAVGGATVGSLVGTTVEHASGDTTGWEYIVRKPNGDLLSVTQREPQPLPIGQKVLLITGNQARVIPDYSVAVEPAPDHKNDGKETEKAAASASKSGTAEASHVAAPDSAPAASASPAPVKDLSDPPASTPAVTGSSPGEPAATTPSP